MKFYVLTLFPEMIEQGMSESIIGRAMKEGLISLEAVNIRDFSHDLKHHHVDDYTYGGGAGMLMQAEPICDAYESICRKCGCIPPWESKADAMGCGAEVKTDCEAADDAAADDDTNVEDMPGAVRTDDTGSCSEDAPDGAKPPRIIYMSPQGRVFNQSIAKELAREDNLVLLCGHYEGVDERALELTGAESLSIGDYVLTGGELAAMVVMDAVSRMVPGVLTNGESGETESFEGSLLEYPQYTRPEEYRGLRVPDVLLSGHHANIERWRREQSLMRTIERRPDLMDKVELDKKDRKYLREHGIDMSSKNA